MAAGSGRAHAAGIVLLGESRDCNESGQGQNDDLLRFSITSFS
jgi:hypothetical protein